MDEQNQNPQQPGVPTPPVGGETPAGGGIPGSMPGGMPQTPPVGGDTGVPTPPVGGETPAGGGMPQA